MTGWIVLLIVLAILFLVSQIRLGGHVTYGADGIAAVIIAGPFRICVYPPKSEEERKPRKKKVKLDKPQEEKKESKGGTIGRLLDLLPTVAETAGALKRRIRIDHLTLRVVWGAEDPASAAIGYGRANALLGMIWPLVDNNFKVKKCDLRADVDYGRTVPEITADAAITMTLGQLVSLVGIYGIKLLMNWSRSGRRFAEKQEAECNE